MGRLYITKVTNFPRQISVPDKIANLNKGPGWCGSVGWSILPWTKRSWVRLPVRVNKYSGCRFDPRSGHLQEGNQLMFLSCQCSPLCTSLSFCDTPSLPLLSGNNEKLSSDEDKKNKLNKIFIEIREAKG